MRKWRLILVLVIVGLGLWWVRVARAVECSSGETDVAKIEVCIADLKHLMDLSTAATTPLESQIKNLDGRIKALQTSINAAVTKQKVLEKNIADREVKITEHYVILAKKTAELYKKIKQRSVLSEILSRVGGLHREIGYQNLASDLDRQLIIGFSSEILNLETDKKTLEDQKTKLAGLQESLNKQAEFFKGEVAKAKAYQDALSGQIAALSARQQEILGQRLSSLNLPTSLGAGPLYCTDDRKLDPGFSGFAFFTFGIPHRVGMNQYGAYGRATFGQLAEQILNAYFNAVDFRGGYENERVKIDGRNEFGQYFSNEFMNIEDYLKHLHEMPADWPDQALQAQAIAARSYALSEMRSKGFLYPNQQDQVIKKEINTDKWQRAVEATMGKVMVQNGQPIKAWFASTSGGYTFTSHDVWKGGDTGWTKRLRDTNGDVNSFADLFQKAYDKDSPCFYAAQGWRNEYAKSAWLKSEEVADIANVVLLIGIDSSVGEHIYQVDKPNPAHTDTWSADRVKQELRNRGKMPFDRVDEISVSANFSEGRTISLRVKGGGKEENFDGATFKDYFNLRVPANIQIVGPLFNIERR